MMEIKIEDIEINGMSFSQVNKEQSLDKIVQKSILSSDVDGVVLDLFKRYITYILNGDSGRMYSANFIISDPLTYDIKDCLTRGLKCDLTQKDDLEKFETISKELASQLISNMQKSTSPKAGILFILSTKIKDVDSICILKLDVAKEEIHIWFDDVNLKVDYDLVKNAMPAPEKVQKGAIYPHPRMDYNLKIIQETYKADYFERFLQCQTNITEFEQLKKVPEILGIIRGELTPDAEMISMEPILNSCFNGLEQNEIFTTQKLIDCAKTIVSDVNEEIIQKHISDVLEKKKILDISIEKDAITRYKKEIRIDDIIIKGPIKSFVDNVIIKTEDDQTYSIIVKGTTKPKEKIVK